MNYFELLFVSWSCLGDASIAGLQVRPVPEQFRPLAASVMVAAANRPLCLPVPELERPLTRERAERRIKELGRGAAPRLRFCSRFKCWDREVRWGQTLFVDGREIK
jgi:hypothetical protein